MTDQLLALKEELVELENKEMELDQHFSWAKQSIHNIMDDASNKTVSFVQHEDLCRVHPSSTLLVIQAPSGTSLEVPTLDMDHLHDSQIVYGSSSVGQERRNKKKYQMHLKSRSGPISVFLVNPQEKHKATVVDVSHANGEPATLTNGLSAAAPEADAPSAAAAAAATDAPVPVAAGEAASESDGESAAVSASKAAKAVKPQEHVASRGTRSSSRVKREVSPVKEKAPSATTAGEAVSNSGHHLGTGLRQLSPRKAAQNHLIVKSRTDRSHAAAAAVPAKVRKTSSAASKQNEAEAELMVVTTDEETMDENKAINNTGPCKRVRRTSEYLSLIEQDIIPDVQQPLVRLSPPPNARDYHFNLDDSEGVADLFD